MNTQSKNSFVRDEEGALLSQFVQSVRTAIEYEDYETVQQLSETLHESDVADLLEHLKPRERQKLVNAIGADINAATLIEVEEGVRDELVEQLPNEQLAEAVEELDTDDAVYLLEDMAAGEREKILDKVPHDVRRQVQRSLDYPEDSAGRLMRASFIHVPSFWTVGQTIDHLRESPDLPDQFSEIFVTTPLLHLQGTIALDQLLRAGRDTEVTGLMDEKRHLIDAHTDQEELARQFERYNLLSAPVVDQDRRLVGVVTVDDVIEVMAEEAEEDILRLGGVSDESFADTVWRTTTRRFTWLFVNLLTSLLASWVISLFGATIEQMVALAVLMPIVASMGGNAGTQTMTVTVRALATRDLSAANAMQVITRESLVGIANGILFAVLMALVTWAWFNSGALALVIALAMIVNMIVAALSGFLIPMALEARKIDPAIASSVFVTTVTDVVGFFVFLGLAALVLI